MNSKFNDDKELTLNQGETATDQEIEKVNRNAIYASFSDEKTKEYLLSLTE